MAMMTYAPVSWAPSSQLLRPSLEIMKTSTSTGRPPPPRTC
jgi:hypothetical protein